MRFGTYMAMVAALMLGACDAGPSAVVHDGNGTAPKPVKPPVQRPAWAAAKTAPAPIVGHADDPPPTQTPEDATPAPNDFAARDAEVAKAYPPLPTGPRAGITETNYGDWPLWSKTRKYSPAENSHNAFDKHGQEVGARRYEDYMAMVHHFVHAPPKGTQTLTRRNGDVLMYDAKSDVFAVITKTGAPRTLFRPFDGEAYWRKQQETEAAHADGDGAE